MVTMSGNYDQLLRFLEDCADDGGVADLRRG
jgi:hypothetical protein